MDIKFLTPWTLTDEGYHETTVQTDGISRIDARFTLRMEKAAAEYMLRRYGDMQQFWTKPGVMPFVIENTQVPPAANGMEMKQNQITLSLAGIRFVEKWLSALENSSE